MQSATPPELLTAAQCRDADRQTVAGGTNGIALMEAAGEAVAKVIARRYAPRPIFIACGGGNNGGDGFVIARVLKAQGWEVRLTLLAEETHLRGDARLAWQRWHDAGGDAAVFTPSLLAQAQLVVDALFGVGLNRAPTGASAEAIRAINASGMKVIAVDMPSGVLADGGEVPGAAVRAACTVTFFRAKPGLFLLPGKEYAGEVVVADIGIPDAALPASCIRLNTPPALPAPPISAHKYTRGHAVIAGGNIAATGAAKLAATASLRAGAGLSSIACPPSALAAYAAGLMAVMTKPVKNATAFAALIGDKRVTAVALGPGNGVTPRTRAFTLAALATRKPCVLDADALTVFSSQPQRLFNALHEHCVLTPHEGEFARLFDVTGNKLERAQAAARVSGATIVLKGNDTVIAAPDGRTAINANAPPWLATAGAGDVLTGVIAGLMAQGMRAFDAACAGVWLHGEAAHYLGPGMIAEDLLSALAATQRQLVVA